MKYLAAVLISLALAMPVQAMQVSFTWGQSSGIVDGYRIMWGTALGGPYDNQLCDVNATGYTAMLDNDKTYYLVVRAYNGHGESGNSNEVMWELALPGIPGSFVIVGVGDCSNTTCEVLTAACEEGNVSVLELEPGHAPVLRPLKKDDIPVPVVDTGGSVVPAPVVVPDANGPVNPFKNITDGKKNPGTSNPFFGK